MNQELVVADQIRAFIKDNDDRLNTKGDQLVRCLKCNFQFSATLLEEWINLRSECKSVIRRPVYNYPSLVVSHLKMKISKGRFS